MPRSDRNFKCGFTTRISNNLFQHYGQSLKEEEFAYKKNPIQLSLNRIFLIFIS